MDLTYIQQPGDTLASTDGGDRYTGLDRFGRVIDQYWTNLNDPTTGTIDRLQYGYDADGNVLYRDDLVNTTYSQVYSYDDLNRITGYTQGTINGTRTGITGTPTNSASYTMDAVGNMTTFGSSSRTVNAQNEITTGTGYTDAYDDNGNLTSGLPVVVIGGMTNGTMIYDAWNDLVSVHYGSTTETYWFDANGERYASFIGGSLTDATTFSANNQPIEDDLTGSTHVTSVWGIDYVNDLVSIDQTMGSSLTNVHYYAQHDLVYSVTSYVDHFGSASARTVFDPYGNATTISSGSFQAQYDQLWQGGRYDYHTQTYWFQNRDYAPVVGTWLEQEPAGASYIDGADLYQAFDDNAIVLTDPDGLDVKIEEIEDDALAQHTDAPAGTAVLRGVLHVRLMECAPGSTRPATQPTTAPATQPDCCFVRHVYDHLTIQTLYVGTDVILKNGHVDPNTASAPQQAAAQAFQDKAIAFERTNWQSGLGSAWTTEVKTFELNVLSIPDGPQNAVRSAIQKEFDALGNRVIAKWQALEASDAQQRHNKPPLRPGWGASQWAKVKLVVNFENE